LNEPEIALRARQVSEHDLMNDEIIINEKL
jgi:hypothetical protein